MLENFFCVFGGGTHLVLAPMLENLCVGGDSPDFGSNAGEREFGGTHLILAPMLEKLCLAG